MAPKQGGVSAWLIKWEWIGGHAAVENPIIAVLSPRLGADQVKRFVELTYAVASYSASEKLEFMQRPATNPYKARYGTVKVDHGDGPQHVEWLGEIVCGHNPWISARLVRNLRAIDEDHLEWERAPRPQSIK